MPSIARIIWIAGAAAMGLGLLLSLIGYVRSKRTGRVSTGTANYVVGMALVAIGVLLMIWMENSGGIEG